MSEITNESLATPEIVDRMSSRVPRMGAGAHFEGMAISSLAVKIELRR